MALVGVRVASVVGLMACGETAPPPPREIVFKLVVEAPAELEVFAEGKKLAETKPAAPRVEVSFKAASERPAISARARLPCGWRDFQLAENGFKRPFFGEGQNGPYSIPGEIILHARVHQDVFYVDNRGAVATTLRLGEIQHAVASDRMSRVQMLAPDCDGGAQLSIGDLSLGTLPPPPPNTPWYQRRVYLIDPTGKRCYEYETIRYSKYPNIGYGPPPPQQFKQQPLHPLTGEPTHLFERAPDSVRGYQMESRSQLLELPCK